MNNDIQDIVTDNVSLKRAYQLSKLQNQRLEHQKSQKQQMFEELENRYQELSARHIALQTKFKKLQAQNQANASGFISQIQQLKDMIEEKEQNLQLFQLKMIPNLDQDMLRVKLIAQMEGPYQEAVDKKDKEISKLKDQIHKFRRQKQMLEYSNATTQRNLRDEIVELKKIYEEQNSRLSKQLAHLACKKNIKTYDNQLISGYKRQINELTITVDHLKGNQDGLRKQMMQLRLEKDKLYSEISEINTKNGLALANASNSDEIRNLKEQRNKVQETNRQLIRDIEKIKNRCKTLEEEKTKNVKQIEKDLHEYRRDSEKTRETLREEIMDLKEQVRRLKDLKNRLQEDNMQTSKKYKDLKSDYESISIQNTQLKQQINIGSSRHQHSLSQEQVKTIEQNIRIRLQKEIRLKIEEEHNISHHHHHENNENISPNKEDNNLSQTKKFQGKIVELEKKIQKLNQKLVFANNKIMELLREKAKWMSQSNEKPNQRSPQKDANKDLLLQYRDCSFVPMCPPIVMQGTSRRKSYI